MRALSLVVVFWIVVSPLVADAVTTDEPLALCPRSERVAEPPPDAAPKSQSSLGGAVIRLPIWLHRTFVSPQDGEPCTFEPSCSQYAEAVLHAAPWTGWMRASDRLLRCHPLNVGDYEIVDGRKWEPPDVPRRRAPGIAVVLSPIPGVGSMVQGRLADGLAAFVTVGILGLGSWYYASQDSPVRAAAAGAFGAFFYVGSVYGGATTAAPSR